jgi:hypothetical protein
MRVIVTEIVQKIGSEADFDQVVSALKGQKIEFSESTVRQYVSVARSELGFSKPRNQRGTSSHTTTVADLMSARKLAEELGMKQDKLLALVQKLSAFGDLAKLEACLEALEELAGSS